MRTAIIIIRLLQDVRGGRIDEPTTSTQEVPRHLRPAQAGERARLEGPEGV